MSPPRVASRTLLAALATLYLSWAPERPSLAGWRSGPHLDASRGLSPPEQQPSTLVLITLDGVRWQEVFEGVEPSRLGDASDRRYADGPLLPTLRRLLRGDGAVIGGAHGSSEFRVSGPSYLSLPGYTQLFTGRSESTCRDNACPRTDVPTLTDAVGRDFGPGHAFVISSWPDLERAAASDPAQAWVSAGRSGGAGRRELMQRGLATEILGAETTSPAPGYGDYRPDVHTQRIAYAALSRSRPRLLFVGLGDPDEHAHRGDYASYLRSLQHIDAWLGRMLALGERLTRGGHPVTFFVTTDHGRGPNFTDHAGSPSAEKIWLVASGAGIRAQGRVATQRELSDLAPTAAWLLGVDLPQATGSVMSELF